MNKFSLGTANFGKIYGKGVGNVKVPPNEIKKILRYLKINKLNFLDTALIYKNEKILKKENLKNWKITTKLPKIITKKNSNIKKIVTNYIESFLKKIKSKNFYGLLLHDTSDLFNSQSDTLYKILISLKKKKIIKKIGVSVYDPKELDILLKKYKIDIVQLPLNVLDRRFAKLGYLKKLKSLGIEIHARSIFLQGLLILKEEEMPLRFKKWKKTWNEWNVWIKKNKVSKLEACISYVKSIPEVDKIVVGVNNVIQLREIISVFKKNKKINFKKNFNYTRKLINPRSW